MRAVFDRVHACLDSPSNAFDAVGVRRNTPAQRVRRRAQERFTQGAVRNEKEPDHYFLSGNLFF